MDEKITIPGSQKKAVWWFITISLYIISTIGLIAGLKIGLEEGVAGVAGTTISAGLAGFLGLLIGMVIQGWETMIVLDWDESDRAERSIGIVMLIIDALALFLALGGHLNIIWISQNLQDTPGMITHILGLSTQVLAAVLGSIGAELALRRTLQVSGVQPITKRAREPKKALDIMGFLRRVVKFPWIRSQPEFRPTTTVDRSFNPQIFERLPKAQ